MQSVTKITGSQLGFILFTFVVSTINLTVPGQMVMFAKQDAWLSVLPAVTTGLIGIWVMTALSRRYPGMSIIQYSSKIVGKWIGTVLGLNYVIYWFISITTISFQHSAFINTLLLPKSPTIISSMTLLVLCGLAVLAGIEVIGRSNEFLTPLLLVFVLPLFLLTFKEADPAYLKPIMPDGIVPVLKGALLPAGAFMNQVFILGWLLPYLNQPKKDRKVSLIAFASMAVLIFIIVSLSIMVLGPLTGRLTYSFLSVIQYIGIEGSFERLEAIAVSIWVLGVFIKTAVSLFILCICIQQIFGLQSYRDIVLPATLISIIGSVWIFHNGSELLNYLIFTFPFLAFINQSLIPLLLLMIDSGRRIGERSRS
ncbi:GerAB/ArcD/ProY family transporter [Paenibacillus silvisoli]|uniref:GerAB/ArcD/ProY family transporter n=1 Tax=Paenibacillus silvisoli TaxID=3110539 RepID=UPI0028054787|nr:endospore germination permease [Paenibacillus silvisoli]